MNARAQFQMCPFRDLFLSLRIVPCVHCPHARLLRWHVRQQATYRFDRRHCQSERLPEKT